LRKYSLDQDSGNRALLRTSGVRGIAAHDRRKRARHNRAVNRKPKRPLRNLSRRRLDIEETRASWQARSAIQLRWTRLSELDHRLLRTFNGTHCLKETHRWAFETFVGPIQQEQPSAAQEMPRGVYRRRPAAGLILVRRGKKMDELTRKTLLALIDAALGRQDHASLIELKTQLEGDKDKADGPSKKRD
jgi:hypothetical protein